MSSSRNSENKPAAFVLVHGAWSGGWCYARVATRSPVWIANRIPPDKPQTVERYLAAIGDAGMTGARWVLDFDRRTIYETQDLPENLSFRIDVPEAVLKDCIQKRMFATWTPSKRLAVPREGTPARPVRVPAIRRHA